MRGGIIVIVGIASVAISIGIGVFMRQVALDALDGGNPRHTMDEMQGLLFFSAISSLFFFGGIFAFVVGIA